MGLVEKKTIKDQAYFYLKDKILSGEYKQGTRINLEKLAKALEISNTPLREAVNMLKKEGLIEYDTKHGITVIKLTKRDITEISNAIAILLIGGYKLCIEQSKQKELITAMEECYQKQEQYFKDGNNPKFLEYSIKFDECLVTISENERLISILNNLNDLFYLVVQDFHTENKNKMNSLKEHKDLLESIKSNKCEDVEDKLNLHYKNSMKSVLKIRY
ncbi:GntR family transcriptional regulator [Neobacillus sp. D3-1R]|uniref:GntR family transcriptional regulator n=1 Tax=Neobacillus sp. D3-1R TaxID=3445778 RepID=UPI003F9FFA8F